MSKFESGIDQDGRAQVVFGQGDLLVTDTRNKDEGWAGILFHEHGDGVTDQDFDYIARVVFTSRIAIDVALAAMYRARKDLPKCMLSRKGFYTLNSIDAGCVNVFEGFYDSYMGMVFDAIESLGKVYGANFNGLNFEGQSLQSNVFEKSSFRGCDLSGCDLSWCNFDGCDFTGADLTGCDVNGASFEGADFTNAKLPKLPKGFKL